MFSSGCDPVDVQGPECVDDPRAGPSPHVGPRAAAGQEQTQGIHRSVNGTQKQKLDRVVFILELFSTSL